MLIDTHCHIHDRETYRFALSRAQFSHKLLQSDPDFPHTEGDFTPEKIIIRAHAAGTSQMICVGTSHEDSLSAQDFSQQHRTDGVFWSYGIHPDEAAKRGNAANWGWSESTSPVAIGEVGLDYHNKTIAEDGSDYRAKQLRLFEQMLQLAMDYDLPLIFHVREAYDDFFAILRNFPGVRGVVHSFSDTTDHLKKALELGFYIGINGIVTFAPEIPLPPLERLLLETDAPFLTPAPFRGTINEPAHIAEICAYISKVKGESEQLIAKITTQNARKLFRLT